MNASERRTRIADLGSRLADAVERTGSVCSPAVIDLSMRLDRLLAADALEPARREPSGEVSSSL